MFPKQTKYNKESIKTSCFPIFLVLSLFSNLYFLIARTHIDWIIIILSSITLTQTNAKKQQVAVTIELNTFDKHY